MGATRRGLLMAVLILVIGSAIAALPDATRPAISVSVCCVAAFILGWAAKAAWDE